MTDLTRCEIDALHEALDDEYRAWATYDRVVADFGEVRPFINIRAAEARHIAALRRLFDAWGLAIPANPWPGRVERYDSIADACRAGVAAEIDNAALFDRLLTATDRPAIRRVFENLQAASQQRHLPAFRRCAGRGPGSGRCGRG